ncbi:CAMK family protein kinase [Tritrichomonas foetus]|uniref:CAMK family protein kinase n=1 Tax=Tritrichomonas foetus TaxID=1144522 RepID=A0A1J4KAP6_9EUKA|nr:CAMK family protein kinase [Tritrichomonas foetus]|eukprot:OHT08503.1 CAMK family protein kinase [Tritrichomonas foetus]
MTFNYPNQVNNHYHANHTQYNAYISQNHCGNNTNFHNENFNFENQQNSKNNQTQCLLELPSSQNIPIPKNIGPYTFRASIGKGSFSEVRLAFNNETRIYYACKIVRRSEIDNSPKRMKGFEDEIRVMQKIHHKGIVELVDLIKDDHFYYIILEYCANGELFDYICDKRRIYEAEAKKLIKQILLSVQYIHSLGIAHRDLKPENLLIDSFGNIKIADFGFSKLFEKDHLSSTICGTLLYLSPEVLSGSKYDPFKSDIWAIGVILYAVLTGMSPWTEKSDSGKIKQIKSGDYTTPNFLSDSCRNLITRLMCVDPNQRISIEEALEHPWLKDVQIPDLYDSYVKATISPKKVDQFFQPFEMALNAISPEKEVGIELKSAPLSPEKSSDSITNQKVETTSKNNDQKSIGCNVQKKVNQHTNRTRKVLYAPKPKSTESIRRKYLLTRPHAANGGLLFANNKNNGGNLNKSNFNRTARKITCL